MRGEQTRRRRRFFFGKVIGNDQMVLRVLRFWKWNNKKNWMDISLVEEKTASGSIDTVTEFGCKEQD